MNKEIGALTGLRGIAALWVFVFHAMHILRGTGGDAYDWSRIIGGAGYLGVDVFFVLSGFVLAYNYGGQESTPRWYAGFIWKRLARIYPVHIAALVVFGISFLLCMALGAPRSGGSRLTGENLMSALTLTHGWSMPIAKHWNPVSWSVSAEFAAYLTFPLVASLAFRIRTAAAAVAVVAALLVVLGLIIYFGEFSGTMAYGLPRIACEFPIGVLLCRVWILRRQEQNGASDMAALCLLVTLIFGFNLIDKVAGEGTSLPFAPVIAAAVVYFLAASKGITERALSSKVMSLSGRLSFSFYMIHGTCLAIADALLIENGLQSTWPSTAVLFAALLASTALAFWLYYSIEEPARRVMIGMYSPGSTSATILTRTD